MKEDVTVPEPNNNNNNNNNNTSRSTTPMSIEEVREIAAKKLQELQNEVQQTPCHTIPSWINRYRGATTARQQEQDQRSEQCKFFDYTGFIHIPSFVSYNDTCKPMKENIHDIVLKQFHIDYNNGNCINNMDTFGTNQEQNITRGNYFLESSNRVHFFLEPNALVVDAEEEDDTNNNNNNTTENSTINNNNPKETKKQQQQQQQRLKSFYCTDETKIYALNKIGHALHILEPKDDSSSTSSSNCTSTNIFHQYTMSKQVRDLVSDLGWIDPVVPQSMYIFKQPNVLHNTNTKNNNNSSSIVHSHQDSTFLYTTPYPTCIGLWLALDDATIENGCLWVRPKSHYYYYYTSTSDNNNNNSNSNNNNNTSNDLTINEDTTLNNTETTKTATTASDNISNTNTNQQFVFDYQHPNVRRQYCRNVLHFGNDAIQQRSNIPRGDTTNTTMFEMKTIFNDPFVPWDGSIPGNNNKNDNNTATTVTDDSIYYESLLQAGFIPIECKAGDLLVFTGTLDHLSLGNHGTTNQTTTSTSTSTSSPIVSSLSSSRHTFQLHIVEGPSQGIEWSPYNWLQYPKDQSFIRLNG